MTIVNAVAIYFLIWWIVLFTVLPFGVRTQEEAGEVAEGTAPSAPARPMLRRKALITTGISAIIFIVLTVAYRRGWLSGSIMSMFPEF